MAQKKVKNRETVMNKRTSGSWDDTKWWQADYKI